MPSRTSNSFFTFVLFLLPVLASAQYDDLLKNKDITWIAEFETDHNFNLDAYAYGGNPIELRYFIAPYGSSSPPNGHWLTWWLLENLQNDEVKVYDDAALKNPLSKWQALLKISSIDTMVTFDPITYEERIQVVRTDIHPDDIRAYRTRQVIYLDGRDGRLHTQLLALAPLAVRYDADGNPTDQTFPLAWMAMDDGLEKKLGYAAPFSWVATIKATVEITSLNTTKGKLNLQQFLYQEAISGKRKVVDIGLGHESEDHLPPDQVEHMFASIDTIVMFDPETFAEVIKIVRNELKLEEIEQVRLIQDWYYDPQQHLLVNRLRAVAPQCNVTDVNGNFKFFRSMFYVVY